MRWWLPPAAALASAALLWAAFFPLNAGWLAWVALVPRLLLIRSPAGSVLSRLWLYGWAWLGGMAFFVATLAWVGYAYHPAMKLAWLMLALYCSFYPPAELWLMRRLDRAGWPPVLSVPVVVCATEWLRCWLITGFGWYYLAHTQHDFLAVIQVADVGGAYAVSALVAGVNAVMAGWVWYGVQASGGRPPWRSTAGVAVVLALALGYGAWRLSQPSAGEGPVVALLQGDQSQRQRNDGATESKQALLDQYVSRAQRLVIRGDPVPDLIVWPETSYPVPWSVAGTLPPEQALSYQTDAIDYSHKMTHELATRILARRSSVLLGMSAYVFEADGKETRHNSAVLVGRDGFAVGRYDKVHCVPFGEFVPFYRELPFLRMLSPVNPEYGLTPGRDATRLPLEARGRTWQVGTLICYEDSDPLMARRYVSSEPKADLLVNMTDDAWFDGSWEPEQHLAIARFRAVECRRPLVRAVHLGVSAVVDGNGRVTALPGPTWRGSRSVAGEVVSAVPLDTRESLYAVVGDWWLAACWLAIGVGVMAPWFRRARVP